MMHTDSSPLHDAVDPLCNCRSLFEISLRLRDGRQTALRISLPPNFPQVSVMSGWPRQTDAVVASNGDTMETSHVVKALHYLRNAVMQHRPGLSVTHPIRHAWVDTAGRLAFPSVLHWVPSQSTLSAVVSEALAELTGSQPASAQSPGHHGSGKYCLTLACGCQVASMEGVLPTTLETTDASAAFAVRSDARASDKEHADSRIL